MQQTPDTMFDFIPSIARRKGDIGIEVEIETMSPLPDVGSWRLTGDGSLRGEYAGEYVLYSPKNYDGVKERVLNLKKKLSEHGVEIFSTVRAGVHIHLNMQGLTEQEFWKFLLTYYILEETLTDACGEGRQGNHFCLRACEAEYIMFMLGRVVQNNEIGFLQTDEIRYSALNLSSLLKYGSVEFRALRTPTDLEDILLWVDILLKLRENSKKFLSYTQIVEGFSLDGHIHFLEQTLGEHAKLFMDDPQTLLKMRRGVRIAQELAYSLRGKPPLKNIRKKERKTIMSRYTLDTPILEEYGEQPF